MSTYTQYSAKNLTLFSFNVVWLMDKSRQLRNEHYMYVLTVYILILNIGHTAHILVYTCMHTCTRIHTHTWLFYHVHIPMCILCSSQANDGSTALHIAGYTGNVSLLELLLMNGANPVIKDDFGRLPLHWSTKPDSPKSLKLLLGKVCSD